jgi:Holliday junction resolvase RusA-like endonuclease
MDALTIVVPGQPVPQPRPRVSTWGGRARAYVDARHPIHAYRQDIALRASVAARAAGWGVLGGPAVVEIEAVFGRPPSHLTKSGRLTASAPAYPPKCDWDNVGKGICDAITDSKAVWRDDDQVVDGRVRKRYARPGEQPRTIVVVRGADDAAAS